jgi:hypothetical protein
MRLRVSDPRLLPELIEFLTSRGDVVALATSNDELDVSLLGSYGNDAMRMELELRIRAWEAGRSPLVELVD